MLVAARSELTGEAWVCQPAASRLLPLPPCPALEPRGSRGWFRSSSRRAAARRADQLRRRRRHERVPPAAAHDRAGDRIQLERPARIEILLHRRAHLAQGSRRNDSSASRSRSHPLPRRLRPLPMTGEEASLTQVPPAPRPPALRRPSSSARAGRGGRASPTARSLVGSASTWNPPRQSSATSSQPGRERDRRGRTGRAGARRGLETLRLDRIAPASTRSSSRGAAPRGRRRSGTARPMRCRRATGGERERRSRSGAFARPKRRRPPIELPASRRRPGSRRARRSRRGSGRVRRASPAAAGGRRRRRPVRERRPTGFPPRRRRESHAAQADRST